MSQLYQYFVEIFQLLRVTKTEQSYSFIISILQITVIQYIHLAIFIIIFMFILSSSVLIILV